MTRTAADSAAMLTATLVPTRTIQPRFTRRCPTISAD